MAATACAYGYQQQQGPRPPLMPPGKFADEDTVKPAGSPAPPPPPPPLPRPSSKVPPSFLLPYRLGLCTEGLGSESSGDIDLADEYVNTGHEELPCKRHHRDRDGGDEEPAGRARSSGTPPPPPASFPPPISVIGAGGKPWLYLRPHREDGRLVLREVRIPPRELLQARREDGRFKLQFAKPLVIQPEDQEPSS
ncbi:hypothetical protein BS78_K232700 [Paspalum vaginatum]|uniref:FAF domain-containing protein n=1 Tax=Paspalum vaginatum TaxID=158149 RepID=A0A9W8CCX5_9POAL|nr:hypothetical protein BS78_K232700 [Paspalum vaginatum]